MSCADKWELTCSETLYLPPCPITFFASLLSGTIDMVFKLDADLSFCGLVSDEGKLEQLLCWWAA